MSSTPPPARAGHGPSPARRIGGLAAGLVIFATALLLPPPAGMEEPAWRVAACTALMAVWWITEAVPVAVTALLPVVLFPLAGVMPIAETAAPYANPLIFLFLGGFLLALAMERWGLHRRLALHVLRGAGRSAGGLLAAFMGTTALLSMWVSNTATAVMMLPIALSVIRMVAPPPEEGAPLADNPVALALLLGIAYGASIGGLGTLIGTPPNALLAAFMAESHGVRIGFAQWMLVGVPLSLVLLVLAWLVLSRIAFRLPKGEIAGAGWAIRAELAALPPMSRAETMVAAVFTMTAGLWLSRPLIDGLLPGFALSDSAIAIFGAVLLFALPVDARKGIFLMDWGQAQKLPWAVLILFGGGLSLAEAIQSSGLAGWIGLAMEGFGHWPPVLIILLVTAVVIFLTEITSNTATAAAFLPLVASFAASMGADPLMLAAPAALAASCAFMLPVATPPNAIVFGSGHVTIPQMARAGIVLNLLAILAITAFAYAVIPAVLAG